MAHPSLAPTSLHLVLREVQGGADSPVHAQANQQGTNGELAETSTASVASAAGGPDVHAWAQDVMESSGTMPAANDTGGTSFNISLDAAPKEPAGVSFEPNHPAREQRKLPQRLPTSNRDSQRHREALLKGVSHRRRRRWENDNLLFVPNAQPPLPSDWEARPTHPVHYGLPYHLAKLWDKGLRQHVIETRAAAAVLRRQQIVAHDAGTAVSGDAAVNGSAAAARVGTVTRKLRTTAKKTPAVKTWVRALEEPVRAFVVASAAARAAGHSLQPEADAQSNASDPSDCDWQSASSDMPCYSDSDEDEIVFVGRRNLDGQTRSVKQIDAGIVMDALGDDHDGSFKRWLTHSISDYYGLASHSVTVDSPSRRVVYVTLPEEMRSAAGPPVLVPRPMWELF